MVASVTHSHSTSLLSASDEVPIRGTSYGEHGINAYSRKGHGSDMFLFLHPEIRSSLDKMNGKEVLDAGCGAGLWSIYAAQRGARVEAIDIQAGMIEKAVEAIKLAGCENAVNALVGDATSLNYPKNSFDHVISVNVACNLPASIYEDHFFEIGRCLKHQGTAAISAPDSLDVVFTKEGVDEIDVKAHIDEVLSQVPLNPPSEEVQNQLNKLKEIVSATFVVLDGKLTLLTKDIHLDPGQEIWRKLTHVTIPNFYYSADCYLDAFAKSGLKVVKEARRHFESENERLDFNSQEHVEPTLGKAYETNAPFVIYHVQKAKQNSCCVLL